MGSDFTIAPKTLPVHMRPENQEQAVQIKVDGPHREMKYTPVMKRVFPRSRNQSPRSLEELCAERSVSPKASPKVRQRKSSWRKPSSVKASLRWRPRSGETLKFRQYASRKRY